jgi:tetratricopeptide (TPR) repeat protein
MDSEVREALAVIDNARARVLYRLGRFREAREAAERALVVTPDLTDARITLASIYMKDRDERGNWIEPTRRHLERALAVSPEDPRLLYRLGRFYDLQRDDDRAQEYYARIPHDWKALDRHAEVLARTGDADGALRLRVRAHRLRPASGDRADALFVAFTQAARASDEDIDAVIACARTGPRLAEVLAHAETLRGRGATPPPAAAAMAP